MHINRSVLSQQHRIQRYAADPSYSLTPAMLIKYLIGTPYSDKVYHRTWQRRTAWAFRVREIEGNKKAMVTGLDERG
jgi:type VI protein secretion system component VasF